jgi:deoxyribonuclease IV
MADSHLFGSHLSIAGGYYKAVEKAASLGMATLQLFTKNNNQWYGKPLVEEDRTRFQSKLEELRISHPVAHDSYLINLGSPDEQLWQKSIDALYDELVRCDFLGIAHLVAHPGAFTTSSEEQGIARIAKGLDEIHHRGKKLKAQVLLETTAGQGSTLGWRFEQLGAIIAQVREPERLGVCFDTCHVFAAGYPMETAEDYRTTMSQLDAAVGLDRIKAFHLNDSKKELGSRVDRHEHIGRGKLGLAPFRHLLADPRFFAVPMYLETAKEQENGVEMDVVNLATLRGLVATEKLPTKKTPATKPTTPKTAKARKR